MPVLILIHLGEQWPHYLKDCIQQARLVNPRTDILLFVNQCHSFRMYPLQTIYKIKPIYVEDLHPSPEYNEFLTIICKQVDLQFRNQYWQYVFERFFILQRYCLQNPLSSIYMIETDNMIYVPLDIVTKTESLFSQDMAAPFDNLEQGYPSVVFFRNNQAVFHFVTYMLNCLQKSYLSDMKILGQYRKEHPESVFPYPVLPSICNTPLRERTSVRGHKSSAEESAFLSKENFPILFDAIAYGQAVGGVDPRNTNGANFVGYINESALYTILETDFSWIQMNHLWFPLVNAVPLVNLHIHSKALSCFSSDRETIPKGEYNSQYLYESLNNDLKTF
jgi:hypothetical protein